MPPRTKPRAGFSGLMASDSDSDFESLPGTSYKASRTSSKAVGAPKPPGRPPANANRVTKPAQRGGHKTHASSTSRQALLERSNNTSGLVESTDKTSRITDESDFENNFPKASQPPRGRPKTSQPHSKNGAQGPKTKASQVEEIPVSETYESMEVDYEEEEIDAEQPEQHPDDKMELSTTRRQNSADSDLEDVSVRRQLGELKERYERLEEKHKDLREIGIKEAERNYDRLKKQSDENTASSNRLVSELKMELTARSSLGKQLERSESEREELQAKVDELSHSLSNARSEIKTLSTKLAAARSAEVGVKVPGSALKGNTGGARGPSAEAVQAAQAKEDLYGDLTGLIIRGMKHDENEDIFDCIQAGRNGTLHFKLALDSDEASGSYEDVQYTYRPQLDPSRDGDLMEVLPSYLLEEITFLRPQASKFYSRVTKCLSEVLD